MANRFLKSLVGSWSLERKCLLFVGLALLASLLLAFYAVQVVAERLVMETTRKSAVSYANAVIGWKHISTDFQPLDARSSLVSPSPNAATPAELARTQSIDYQTKVLLRKYMLQSGYEYEILRIEDFLEHESLKAPLAMGKDLERLNRLHAKLAESDSIAADEARIAAEKAVSTGPRSLDPVASGRDSQPITNPLTAPAQGPQQPIFQESRSSEFFYYYHPIAFDKTCLRECHTAIRASNSASNAPTLPSLDPFRVMKVKMPYSETR